MSNEKITILGIINRRPNSFRYVSLGPEPLCQCGHTRLEHRLDKTCGKCLCIRWQEQPTQQDEKENYDSGN